jgi:hypothetical protein
MNKQAKANRANAKHSTGPKSAEGKQRASLNALAHGLNQRIDHLICPEVSLLQALFEDDGIAADEALALAEAHATRARVRAARQQAWQTIYGDVGIDSKQRGSLYNAPPELLTAVNQQMGGSDWQHYLPFLFEKPFESGQEQDEQAALRFLDKQRRLNRYEVKAVSLLSKLYKRAYL